VARSRSELRRVLTLGGQAPLSVGTLVVAMAVATVAGTAWPWLAGLLVLSSPGPGPDWLDLAQVWRLLTWPLYQGRLPNSLLDLIFGGFMVIWLGRQLYFAWSERRFLGRVALISAGAGAATLLALSAMGRAYAHSGIWALANALLVTWGLLFPGQRLSWFGALEMSGSTVAWFVTLATPVWALVVGQPLAFLPHQAAVGMAWLLAAAGPRRSWYRLRSWWAERRLDRQRRRFKVVTTDRSSKPPQWMN
jgi:hypothetical protein